MCFCFLSDYSGRTIEYARIIRAFDFLIFEYFTSTLNRSHVGSIGKHLRRITGSKGGRRGRLRVK